jgi:hypothetical protein
VSARPEDFTATASVALASAKGLASGSVPQPTSATRAASAAATRIAFMPIPPLLAPAALYNAGARCGGATLFPLSDPA